MLDFSKLNLEEVFAVKNKVDTLYNEAEVYFDKAFASYLNNESDVVPENDVTYNNKIDNAIVWLHKLYDLVGGSQNISEFYKIAEQHKQQNT